MNTLSKILLERNVWKKNFQQKLKNITVSVLYSDIGISGMYSDLNIFLDLDEHQIKLLL